MTALAIWIYLIVALGAIGVYLMLPKRGRSTKTAGTLLGLAALAGLIFLSVDQFASAERTDVYFYIFSAIALVCATCVITQTRAVFSALYFVVVILAVAGMLILLEAEFLAAALVIIYAGAILVTYVFVIMLAQQTGQSLYDSRARAPLGACFCGFLLVATVGGTMTDVVGALPTSDITPAASVALSNGEQSVEVGNTQAVGAMLMTRYVVVLEVAGVLLLLAMVGAIAIARKKFPRDKEADTQRKIMLGEAGRKAAPF